MHVNDPSKDILDSIPVPTSGQRLLKASRVLDLPWYGWEDLLEGVECQIRDPLFLDRIPLSGANQIIHVDTDVLNPVRGRQKGSRSVIGLSCRQVNGKGRGRIQGVDVGVIHGSLGCGSEEFR